MAAKAIRKTTKSQSQPRTAEAKGETKTSLLDYFRFGESYTSLILGIVVVIIASILLLSFARNNNIGNLFPGSPKQDTSSTKTEPPSGQDVGKGTYVVQSGDSLWSIAEKRYNDGYKWSEIAKANNVSNPGVIEVGMRLTMPAVAGATEIAQVSPVSSPTAAPGTIEQPQVQPVPSAGKITGNSYTVARGDYLWDIAIRAYGDGYQWVKIAKANKLENPDLIFSGNRLVLPR